MNDKLNKPLIDKHILEYSRHRGALSDNWNRFGKIASRVNRELGTSYTRRDLLLAVGLPTEKVCNDRPAYMPGDPIVTPVAVKKVVVK